LHSHIKELSENYASDMNSKVTEINSMKALLKDLEIDNLDTVRMPDSKEEDRVAKVYKLLSNVCQTNY